MAATPTGSLEAENATNKLNVTQVSDSGASGSSYLRFGENTPPPSSNCRGSISQTGIPNATSTGPYTTNLTRRAGGTITTSQYNVEFTSAITISGTNVNICNFKVNGGGAGYAVQVTGSNVLMEDGDIFNARSALIRGGNFTARRLHVHEVAGDGVKPTSNVTFERSYFHRMGLGDPPDINYGDCFQMIGGTGLTVRGSFCDDADTTDSVNAGFQLQASSTGDRADNILIEGNWFLGGGRGIECKDDPPGVENVTIRNNYFRDTRPVTGMCSGINNMTF